MSSPIEEGHSPRQPPQAVLPRVLHIGCGFKDKTSFPPELQACEETRLDITEDVRPDVLADMRDLTVISSDSFDVVYSSHNVEHVFSHEVVPMLAEWRRVIKPGGFLYLRCPDLKRVCQRVVDDGLITVLYESASGPIRPLDILYGHVASVRRGEVYMAHKTGFTRDTLGRVLQKAGFSRILLREEPELYELVAQAFK